jgi:hypothetical protein
MIPTLVLLVLFIIGAEVFLRSRFEKIEHITGVVGWSLARYGDLSYRWDQYDPDYGWTNVPDYRSDKDAPFELSINSQGLRASRDYDRAPAKGSRRIAVFGDSCAFGEEVNDDQTIPVHLERSLKGVEVLNFGVHGFGLGQMMLRLEREGLEFEPDHVVLVLMIPWDLYRMKDRFFVHAKPVFTVRESVLQIENHPVPEASRMPWLYRHSFAAAWSFARRPASEESTALSKDIATTTRILERIQQTLMDRGIGFTLATIVVPGELDMVRRSPRRLEALARIQHSLSKISSRLGLDLLDQVPSLVQEYAVRPEALAMKLGHWSGLGNCLIAKPVAEHLASEGSDFKLRSNAPDCE